MPSVTDVSDRFVDRYSQVDPVHAARAFGVALDSASLTDHSPGGMEAQADLFRATLAELEVATVDGEAERLGAGFLRDWVEGRLSLLEAGELSASMSTLVGPPAMVRQTFDLMDTGGDDGPQRVAERLAAVPGTLEGYRESLLASCDRGLVAPLRLVGAVAEQCRTWSERGWFDEWSSALGLGEDDRVATAAGAADAAYGDLADWLGREYAPAAEHSDGVGEERYRLWAASLLGAASLDLDELYSWGWEELTHIEEQLAAESHRVVPGAGFAEVRDLLDRDPDRAVHGVAAYREWLQELTDAAIDGLHGEEFDIPEPLRRCEVVIPPEGSAAAPHYTPPSEDLATPGRTWYPTRGRTSFPRWHQVTTVYHESVPGHHLQVGVTRVVPLTRFHRLGFNPAHGEGWALYAERLMDELGWFDTPESRLGFLAMQAMRAARVVIDIGLHTGRTIPAGRTGGGGPWTFDLAVEHLAATSKWEGPAAESEVHRYLSWPSQAISYKLGERAWLAARERAERREGAAFDRPSWHRRTLSIGPCALDRFALEIDAVEAREGPEPG